MNLARLAERTNVEISIVTRLQHSLIAPNTKARDSTFELPKSTPYYRTGRKSQLAFNGAAMELRTTLAGRKQKLGFIALFSPN